MTTEQQPRWAPQPGPQAEAIAATWCQELLYGGAAGSGKTDLLLGDFLQDVPQYGDAWQGAIFRRTYRELEEIVTRSLHLYPPTGGTWEATRHRWIWPNGATLRLRYLERDVDVTRYQGAAFSWIGWDELGQFPSPYAYRYLRSRLRSAKPVPTKRIRSTANPGGAGHHWLRAMFIDPDPLGFTPLIDPETGAERMFVPARLTDNQILLSADPHYAMRLKGMGSPELVRAMLEGDWSVIVGSFFPEFSLSQHVIPVFTPPEHWLRFRSFDWGSARPFAVGWWAQVAEGSQWPKGALVKYREWYGSTGEPNVGLRLTAEQVADGIKMREAGDRVAYGVADPSIFAQDGGPSIAERMFARGVTWRPADNTRIARHGAMGGWDLFRQRLRGEDGKPMAYWQSCCRDAIRTIPAMQHDDARPEDLASELEDHCFAAGTMVQTPSGDVPIEALPACGWVSTPTGPRRYRSAGLIARSKPTIRMSFADGSKVDCTPDHKMLADTGEWIEAIEVWRSERYLTVCTRYRSLAQLSKSFLGFATIAAAHTSKRMAHACIGLFGAISMVPSPAGLTSTTTISTRATTHRPTWSAWKAGNTARSMGNLGPGKPAWFRQSMLGGAQRNGTGPRRGSSGIGNITSAPRRFCTGSWTWFAHAAGRPLSGASGGSSAQTHVSRRGAVEAALTLKSVYAKAAARSSGPTDTVRHSGAVRMRAAISSLECVGLEFLDRQDVYCLTVPDAGCFLLGNGLVVSNCCDADRYAFASRPWMPAPEAAKPPPLPAGAIRADMLIERNARGGRI